VVDKPTVTSKTGVKSCPDGAQVAFESASGHTGLLSEVLACSTSAAAAALLSGAQSGTSGNSGAPPRQPGSSGNEGSSGGSTYLIYWRRGKIVEVVALNTNVPAGHGSSTSTTITTTTIITSAQQKALSNAAIAQDALLK